MNVSIDELLMKLDHEQFHGPSSGPEQTIRGPTLVQDFSLLGFRSCLALSCPAVTQVGVSVCITQAQFYLLGSVDFIPTENLD